MVYVIFAGGVVLFVIAGIHQIAWLGILSIFVSITAMLVGGRAPARWVRVRTFVRRPTRQLQARLAGRPVNPLQYHFRRVSRQVTSPTQDQQRR